MWRRWEWCHIPHCLNPCFVNSLCHSEPQRQGIMILPDFQEFTCCLWTSAPQQSPSCLLTVSLAAAWDSFALIQTGISRLNWAQVRYPNDLLGPTQLPATDLLRIKLCLPVLPSFHFLQVVHCHCIEYVDFLGFRVSLVQLMQKFTQSSSSSVSTIPWLSAEFNAIDYQSPAYNPISVINSLLQYLFSHASYDLEVILVYPIYHQVLSIVGIALEFAHLHISMVSLSKDCILLPFCVRCGSAVYWLHVIFTLWPRLMEQPFSGCVAGKTQNMMNFLLALESSTHKFPHETSLLLEKAISCIQSFNSN